MSNTVPEGWSKVVFDEIADIKRGITYFASELVDEASGRPLYVNMKSFKKDGGYNVEGEKYFGADFKERDLASSSDLFIANTDVTPACDIIGAPALVPDNKWARKVLCSHHVSRLAVKDATSNRYLYYLLMTPNARYFMKSIGRGTTVKMLDADALKKYEMVLPPLPEQQKIADILSSVDNVIEKTRAQIDKLKDLKTGMMQELFSNGIGHIEFKDSPVGRIPSSWEVKELSAVAKVIDCKHATPKYFGDGYPVVKPGNIKEGNIDLSGCSLTDKDGYDDLNENHKPRKGDTIYSRNQTYGIGAFVHADLDFAIGQDVCVIHPKSCNPKYLFYAVNSPIVRDQVELLAAGSTFKRINLGSIRKLLIPAPPNNEQVEIASVLSALDNKVLGLEKKLSKARNVKKALMQDLLTGKVRVKVDQKESAVA